MEGQTGGKGNGYIGRMNRKVLSVESNRGGPSRGTGFGVGIFFYIMCGISIVIV